MADRRRSTRISRSSTDGGKQAFQLLLDKYAPHLRPGVHYRPTTDDELKRTAVYRLAIESWSGKRDAAPADFPGAFRYGEVPE